MKKPPVTRWEARDNRIQAKLFCKRKMICHNNQKFCCTLTDSHIVLLWDQLLGPKHDYFPCFHIRYGRKSCNVVTKWILNLGIIRKQNHMKNWQRYYILDYLKSDGRRSLIGLWDVEALTYYRQFAHRWRRAGHALPPEIFLVLISVSARSTPKAIVLLKRLG
jgi:hypothetical protein